MKLEYQILWIDNDLQDYIDNGDVESIRDYLTELGFDPNIVPVFDEANLDKYLNIKYDLIISDFNLNKENGDVIIYRLREEKKLDTEILFYSAKSNFLDNKEVKERLAFMERINIQIGRDTLLGKIEKVIELTIQKLLELNATRGLITSATSELDVIIEELILKLLKILKKTKKDEDKIIKSYVEDFLAKSPEKFMAKYDEIGFQDQFPQMDANRKWRLFRDLIKEYKIIDSNEIVLEFHKINKTYFNEVIDIRNKFAHAKAENQNGKLVLKGQYGKDGFEFDNDSCIEIRKNIKKHKDSFEKLVDYLNQ